ncbi:hypothetical protein C2845_PM12G07400 [Panicum miliaceum]|uniref:Uncharacterized protein n=1 Tax=Panicum miliaceum TaxID=4540 RepID=A0A3L6QI33_PANMI|nr:hypothetical protein C2845_PM12G07400 [Panicum miliaceum]
MWPAAPMFAVGVLLWPFTALAPSGRNLTALLPELRDLLGSLYRHCRGEFVLLASTRRWR